MAGGGGGVVVVFDFDKTIIDCDSDNWVVDQLGVTDLFNQLLSTLPWNSLMNKMMMELHSGGTTIDEIAKCLREVPLHPRIASAIKSAHANGCDLRIVSDANDFFIETILRHHGLIDCFREINTNPSYVDKGGRLRISPYYDFFNSSSHGCNICPPNMCKGLLMEKIQASTTAERFIFVGDGSPDFCAGLKLQEGDHLMPRKAFPLWEIINAKQTLIKAAIHEWRDGADLESILLHLIKTSGSANEENFSSSKSDELVAVNYELHNSTSSTAVHEGFRNALPVPH